MQALGENQERWLQTLESGKHEQTSGWLRVDDAYCCLGVGCELFKLPSLAVRDNDVATYRYGHASDTVPGNMSLAPVELVDMLALRGDSGDTPPDSGYPTLTEMNDNGMTFKAIAAAVRKNPEAYFTEPR